MPDPYNHMFKGMLDRHYWETNFHRDGVPWDEAPRPPWLHRCKAQTCGSLGPTVVDQCACGGIRRQRHWWHRRNSRFPHWQRWAYRILTALILPATLIGVAL